MGRKKVMIAFADRRLDPKDHVEDIKKAIESASLGLRYRHKIIIEEFNLVEVMGFISLVVKVPDNKKIKSLGIRLKGISRYLIHECEFPYKNYLVGDRLLSYFEWEMEKGDS